MSLQFTVHVKAQVDKEADYVLIVIRKANSTSKKASNSLDIDEMMKRATSGNAFLSTVE